MRYARQNKLVSAEAAARQLGVHGTTMRQWIRDRYAPAVRFNSRYYVSQRWVDGVLHRAANEYAEPDEDEEPEQEPHLRAVGDD